VPARLKVNACEQLKQFWCHSMQGSCVLDISCSGAMDKIGLRGLEF
jgi:hypothetical protein